MQFTVEASPPGLYTPLEYYLHIHHILPQVNEVLMHYNLWAQYKPCKIFLLFFKDLPPGRWFYQNGATLSDIAVIYGLVVPFIQLQGKSGEIWIIGGCQQAPVAMKLEYSTFALAQDMQWDYLCQRFKIMHLQVKTMEQSNETINCLYCTVSLSSHDLIRVYLCSTFYIEVVRTYQPCFPFFFPFYKNICFVHKMTIYLLCSEIFDKYFQPTDIISLRLFLIDHALLEVKL